MSKYTILCQFRSARGVGANFRLAAIALLSMGALGSAGCLLEPSTSTRRYEALEREWHRSAGAGPAFAESSHRSTGRRALEEGDASGLPSRSALVSSSVSNSLSDAELDVELEEGASLFASDPYLERAALVRAVLVRNPNLHAARYAWRAAIARYPQVTALDDPMLGLGISPRSIDSNEVDPAPQIDLSQKLPFPGKLRLRGQAALAEAEAMAQDHAAVELRLATMASLLYDDYYLASRALEINAEHIALLEEFQRIATARYETGEASQQDPIQAEVELTHALHRDLVLGTNRRITLEQINALLHRGMGAALPPAPPRMAMPANEHHEDDAARLTERALEDRPELAAAAARIEAEASRVDLARREYFPDVTVLGSYNRRMPREDVQGFVGVQLAVPIQLGRRRGALEEARARLEQARSRRRALEDEVRLSVQTGAERLAESRHVVRLFRDRLVPAAEDQIAAARSGFETGRNTFLALIDAQRNLRNVELGYEQALADLGHRRAELDRSLGRLPGLAW